MKIEMYAPNLALIGGGYWGKNLARNFLAIGALHTICDSRRETLDSYGEEYKSVSKLTRFDDVLADPSIHSVAIAAPAALHYKLAHQSILAGKHVFVEKPLCLSTHEGIELIALAKDYGRTLMVGHLLQYHPCIVKLQSMVATGELGRLFYMTSNRLNLGKIRSEENALWSFAPHDISVILALAGKTPETVQCTGENYLTPGVADTTMTQLAFTGGLRAHIFVSWMNPFKEQKLTVIGSEGMVVFDDTKPWSEKLTLYRDYLKWENGQTPVAMKCKGVPVVVPELEPLAEECKHFLECYRSGKVPITDGNEGLRVLQVLDAAQRSLENHGERVHATVVQNKPYFSHSTATIDDGASIGKNTKVWHYSHISARCQLGENCNLGQNVFVASGVEIGANVKIQNNVSIYSGTKIEDNVFLGPSCVLTNVSNPRSEIVRKSVYERTLIRRGASVGANATIVCGVTIGKYAFVAAGATVTKDVPDYGLMKGIPAKQFGWLSRHAHPLRFNSEGLASCPESQLKYQLQLNDEGVPCVRCLDLDEDESLPIELTKGTVPFQESKRIS
jgi:UDP-2-acetamido-3-amino-2,3-dideoxy-glucuronate N-acetyltransferase